MIALFLDAPLIAQVAFVVGGLCMLFLAGLLVWAYLWPLGDLDANDYGADDVHPCLKENCDGR